MVVTLRYGPYEMHGIIRHKKQRLRGIMEGLKERGFPYQVLEISKLNQFEVEMCNRIIASCDIRYLKFNLHYEYDPVSQRVLDLIFEFAARIGLRKASFAADSSSRLGSSSSSPVYEDESVSSTMTITNFDDYTSDYPFTVPPNTQGDTLFPSYNCNAGSLISVTTTDIGNFQENFNESTPDLRSVLSFDPSHYYTLCHNSICDLHLRSRRTRKSQPTMQSNTRQTRSFSDLRNTRSQKIRVTTHVSNPEISKCPKSSTSCSSINEEDYCFF